MGKITRQGEVSVVSDYQASLLPNFREEWKRLLELQSQQLSFLQTPEFFDHLATTQNGMEIFLAILAGEGEALAGIVPLRKMDADLDFSAGHRVLGMVRFNGLHLLGGNIVWPKETHQHLQLLEVLLSQFADSEVIQVSGISVESPFWASMTTSPEIARKFHVYMPYGVRQCLFTHVPGSVKEYFESLGAKKRYNLKRQLDRLKSFSNNALELRRVASPHDLSCLLESFETSGFNRRDGAALSHHELLDLANRGLLLGYVLTSANRPIAFAFCHRALSSLFVHKIWHDRKLDSFSPGSILHYLMMQDIIAHQLATRIEYGFGMPRHGAGKHNIVEGRANVYLFRKKARYKLFIGLHSLFVRVIDTVKSGLGSKRIS